MSEIPIKAMKYDDANKDPHQFYPLTVPEALIFPDGTTGKQAFNSIISNMSDVFSEASIYEVGDYCIYNNVLYKFIAQKTAGAWDSTKASATTIDAELKALANQLSTLNSGLSKKLDNLASVKGFEWKDNKLIAVLVNNQRLIIPFEWGG